MIWLFFKSEICLTKEHDWQTFKSAEVSNVSILPFRKSPIVETIISLFVKCSYLLLECKLFFYLVSLIIFLIILLILLTRIFRFEASNLIFIIMQFLLFTLICSFIKTSLLIHLHYHPPLLQLFYIPHLLK